MKWKLSIQENFPDIVVRLVVLAATVSATILLVYVLEAEGEQKVDISPYAERLTQLDRQAAEEAYVQHIMKLFNVWVTDYSEEPPKAIKGAQNARSAFVRIMNAIEKREKELEERERRGEAAPPPFPFAEVWRLRMEDDKAVAIGQEVP